MNVTFYSRDLRVGNFSIEELFRIIKESLPQNIVFKHYYVKPIKPFLMFVNQAIRAQGEVNHITGDINYIALFLSKKNTILTVHDFGHLENLRGIKKIIYKFFWFYIPLKRVKYVTVVSNYSKNKLFQYFKINPDKVFVIHNPYPKEFIFSPKKFNKDKPVILQIGTGKHKNLENLIEAVKGLPCKLNIIGNPDEKLIEKLKAYNIEFHIDYNLNFKEVHQRYLECDIVYFASLHEGFGLPIIEGNAIGRVVITSNLCSMPEVASDAAFIVNPYQFLEIRNAIKKISEDDTFRESLIKKGLKNIERFHPDIIAEQYYKIYKNISE